MGISVLKWYKGWFHGDWLLSRFIHDCRANFDET